MDTELISQIEKILKITYQIHNIYEKLIFLETNKELINDVQIKIEFLYQRLKILKSKEDELYNFFKDNLAYASITLNYINNNLKKNLEEKDINCISRVIKNLSLINNEILSINTEIIPNGTINNNVENYLINQGFDEDDTKAIILKLSSTIESSIATAIFNIINSSIINITNYRIKTIYIKRKYHTAFINGYTLENKLIDNNFNYLSNDLKQNMNNIIKISSENKQQLLSMLLANNIKKIINDFIYEKDPEQLDELLIKFKAYMSHLAKKDLDNYYTIISFLSLSINFNAKVLLNEINNVIILRERKKKQL